MIRYRVCHRSKSIFQCKDRQLRYFTEYSQCTGEEYNIYKMAGYVEMFLFVNDHQVSLYSEEYRDAILQKQG